MQYALIITQQNPRNHDSHGDKEDDKSTNVIII